MKRKLLLTLVSAAMVSFAAYSSLQTTEDVSLSDIAMENAEALTHYGYIKMIFMHTSTLKSSWTI